MKNRVCKIKIFIAGLMLFYTALQCPAAVEVKEEPGRLVLENNLVRLTLDADHNYVPIAFIYKKGTNENLITNPTGEANTNIRFAYGYLDGAGNDKWVDEDNRFEDKFTDLRHSISKNDVRAQLTVSSRSPNYELKKTITIHANSPEISFDYEINCIKAYTGTGIALPHIPISPLLNKQVVYVGDFIDRTGKCSEKTVIEDRKSPKYEIRAPHKEIYMVFNEATGEGLLGVPLNKESSGSISVIGNTKIAAGDKEKVSFKLIPFKGEDPKRLFMKNYRAVNGMIEKKTTEKSAPKILLKSNDLTIWTDYATHRIFPEEQIPENAPKATGIEIEAGRNEYESFQIALRPAVDLDNVRIEMTRLIGKGPLCIIDKDNLRYNPVSPLISFYDEEIPDLLLHKKIFNCRKGENNVIWATVKVPEYLSPGTYSGKIRIFSGEKKLAELNLKLKVWNFTLPKVPHIYVHSAEYLYTFDREVDLNSDDVYKYVKEVPRADRLKYISHLKFLAEHRVYETTCYLASNPIADWKQDKDGKWNFSKIDFNAFDQMQKYSRNELNKPPCAYELAFFPYTSFINQFTIGGKSGKEFFYMKYWDPLFPKKDEKKYYPHRYDLSDDFTPEFKEKFTRYVKMIADHCRKKDIGIDANGNGPSYFIGDEVPEFSSGHPVIKKLVDLAKLIKAAEPRIILEINGRDIPNDPELINLFDVWVVRGFCSPEQMSMLKSKGRKLSTYYMSNYMFINSPAITPRMQFWFYWKYKFDYVATWCMSVQPVGEYYKSRFGRRGRQTNGTPINYKENWFFPNMEDPMGEPMSTIRFEQLREGMEDAEYFFLLQDKLKQIRNLPDNARHTDIIKKGEELLGEAAKLAGNWAPPKEDWPYWHHAGWEEDSAKIYSLRQKIGNELDALCSIIDEKAN